MPVRLYGRKLNADIFDTGLRDSKGKATYRAEFAQGKNYVSPSGLILPVDTTVFEHADWEFTHKVDKARCITRYGDSSGNSKKHLVGIEDREGNWLNVKLDRTGYAMSGIPGNKPTFPQAGELTVEHEPTYRGIKTYYRLGSSGINEIQVTFKYNKEIVPEQRGNSIVFARGGADKIILPSPFAFDGSIENGIEPATMTLADSYIQGNYGYGIATITVDSGWLAVAIDPVIDPTLTIQDSDGGRTSDAHIYDGSPNNNYGATTSLIFRETGGTYNILLKTDISELAGAEIKSLYFQLYCYFNDASMNSIAFHKVLKDWGEGDNIGSTANAGECSWNNAKSGSLAWQTAGCLGAEDRDAASLGSFSLTTTGWKTLNLPASLGQEWVDTPANNNGVVMYPNAGLAYCYSSEGSTKPKMVVEYTVDGNIFAFFSDDE